jgi:hypothetical protein
MKLILLTSILICSMTVPTFSQADSLPYSRIPEHPESYTAGSVMSRLIDGLGFRYYWATEGLSTSDLGYKPSVEARTMMETLDHIYGLSLTIVNAPQQIANIRPQEPLTGGFEERRAMTLENFKKASDILKTSSGQDLESYMLIFKRGEQQNEFPFWNLINGPISDALWHTGQVVLMRRAAGNPISSGVDVFTGRVKE